MTGGFPSQKNKQFATLTLSTLYKRYTLHKQAPEQTSGILRRHDAGMTSQSLPLIHTCALVLVARKPPPVSSNPSDVKLLELFNFQKARILAVQSTGLLIPTERSHP